MSLSLPGYDLWLTYIKNVHLISSRIDIERFRKALEYATELYTHSRGKLVSDGTQWKIELIDHPVLLDISSSDEDFPWDSHVIQNHEALLSFLSPTTSPVNTNFPLLLIRLTFFPSNSTAIGVCWYHCLGDAMTLLNFMRTLSEAYQDAFNAVPSPILGNHRFSSPSLGTIDKMLPLLPHITHTYSAHKIGAMYTLRNESIAHILETVSLSRLEALRARIQSASSVNLKLSLQDCLTAYIVTLINRYEPGLVNQVTNAANEKCRIAGNHIYIVPSDTFPDGLDECQIALNIRQSLNKARDPSFLHEYMGVADHLMLHAANKNESMYFGKDPHTMSVNSNLAIDWLSVNFGSSSPQFYTSGVSRFYLRVFHSNREGHVDIAIGVPANLKDLLVQGLYTDLKSV